MYVLQLNLKKKIWYVIFFSFFRCICKKTALNESMHIMALNIKGFDILVASLPKLLLDHANLDQ